MFLQRSVAHCRLSLRESSHFLLSPLFPLTLRRHLPTHLRLSTDPQSERSHISPAQNESDEITSPEARVMSARSTTTETLLRMKRTEPSHRSA